MQDSSQENDQNSSKNDEHISGSMSDPAKKTVDMLADTANQVIDILGWISNRLNTNGSLFKIEDARGATAEVSLPIPVNGLGEVTVVLGKMRKSYPAKAVRPDEEFKRGTIVRIADVGVNTMFVECV